MAMRNVRSVVFPTIPHMRRLVYTRTFTAPLTPLLVLNIPPSVGYVVGSNSSLHHSHSPTHMHESLDRPRREAPCGPTSPSQDMHVLTSRVASQHRQHADALAQNLVIGPGSLADEWVMFRWGLGAPDAGTVIASFGPQWRSRTAFVVGYAREWRG
jgi:hypothetical protein